MNMSIYNYYNNILLGLVQEMQIILLMALHTVLSNVKQ